MILDICAILGLVFVIAVFTIFGLCIFADFLTDHPACKPKDRRP